MKQQILFDINEFVVGKVLNYEEFVNTKRIHMKEFTCKKYFDGRFVVCYKKNESPLLVHDIATNYRQKFNDNALLIFIQKHNEASLVCFIDSTNTFAKNKVLIQEIDINKYENDYRKMEETILHFTTKERRPVKVFLPSKQEEEDNLDMIDKILNDFSICSREELLSFFPRHSLAGTKKQSFLSYTLVALVLSFVISNTIFSEFKKYLVEKDKKELTILAQEKFSLQNIKNKLQNDEFIINEDMILNADLKEIAR
ncbi:MAG: hypothetical protein PHE67_04105 [Campylobacterales bacterium]|nr:hypothetical protein [Campylobacterales bacterium]